MLNIRKPDIGYSAREIFELLSKSFRDAFFMARLLDCAEKIEQYSSYMELSFPENLKKICVCKEFDNGITYKDMLKVYTEKFSKQGTVGRQFYDKILASPKLGICPICGDRPVSNLDHYMPQSEFCTLTVTPSNLVPICRDCNYIKRAFKFSSVECAPIHPYFDNVENDIWLLSRLNSDQTVEYYVECPKYWSKILRVRVENSFKLYELNKFYAIKAGQEIADSVSRWTSILTEDSTNGLFEYLVEEKNSKEVNQLNSWRSALYRGLISDFEILLQWISPPTPRTVDPTTPSTDV